jgi:hypothetical protein
MGFTDVKLVRFFRLHYFVTLNVSDQGIEDRCKQLSVQQQVKF